MFYSLKISLIILILSPEINCGLRKGIEDYSFLYLLIVDPGRFPHQHHQLRICSAIMLVEDTFYLTAKICFEKTSHNQIVKVAMIHKEEHVITATNQIYENFVMKTNDLEKFVILRKQEDQSHSTTEKSNTFDVLLEPRVLLTFANSPTFTHCYCLGWISYFHKYDQMKSAFASAKVHATWLGNDYEHVLVEREEGERLVKDYGSPLLCEMRDGDEIIASAVVGLYTGGDDETDSIQYNLITYRTFSGTMLPIAKWAPGTNFSIYENLSYWTIWPFDPYRPSFQNPDLRSGADISSDFEFLFRFNAIFFATVNISLDLIVFILISFSRN